MRIRIPLVHMAVITGHVRITGRLTVNFGDSMGVCAEDADGVRLTGPDGAVLSGLAP